MPDYTMFQKKSCSMQSNFKGDDAAQQRTAQHSMAQQRTAQHEHSMSTAAAQHLPDDVVSVAPVVFWQLLGLFRSHKLTPQPDRPYATPPTMTCILRARRGQAWQLHAATCPARLIHAAASAVPSVPGPPTQPFMVSITVDWHPQICFGCLAAEE